MWVYGAKCKCILIHATAKRKKLSFLFSERMQFSKKGGSVIFLVMGEWGDKNHTSVSALPSSDLEGVRYLTVGLSREKYAEPHGWRITRFLTAEVNHRTCSAASLLGSTSPNKNVQKICEERGIPYKIPVCSLVVKTLFYQHYKEWPMVRISSWDVACDTCSQSLQAERFCLC